MSSTNSGTDTSQRIITQIRKHFITGAILLIPLFVTIFILVFALNFVVQFVRPLSEAAASILNIRDTPTLLVEVTALAILCGFMIVLGLLANALPTQGAISNLFHSLIESVPVAGTVYGSVRQMGETVINGEDSFNDVKLVEHPTEGTYTFAFTTADTPAVVQDAVNETENMTTLFMPMGPNPIMGGHVIYAPDSRVHDIDLTVEQGLQAVITSGVTLGDSEETQTLKQEFKQLQSALRNETSESD